MSILKQIATLTGFLVLLGSCSTLHVEKPPETYLNDRISPKLSVINIPFHFDSKNLEKLVNKQLTGMIYADTSYDDNNNDGLMLRAWKKADIRLAIADNELRYSVPLRVWISKRFSLGSFGINLTDTKSVTAEILLKFKTKISVNKNWTLSTVTQSDGYEWISTPEIRLGSVTVPLPFISDLLIQGNLSAVNAGIDKSLRSLLDVRKILQKTWTDLQQPVQIPGDYPLWLSVQPMEVTMVPLQSPGGLTNPVVGITARAQLFYDRVPDSALNTTALPELKITSRLDDSFNINLPVTVPFEQITEMARKELAGYHFEQGKYKITIQDLSFYGSGDKLVVALRVDGSLRGTVYLSGKPCYEKDSGVVRIIDLDFDLHTKNVLAKSASWVYHQGLLKLVKDKLSYPVGEQLTGIRTMLQSYLDRNQSYGLFTVSGRIDGLDLDEFIITRSAIHVLCVFNGRMKVGLNDR